MEERLDKVMATTDWCNLLDKAYVENGVVEDALKDRKAEGLISCLHLCGERLRRWGEDHFHKFGERIRLLRRKQLSLRRVRDPTFLAEFQLLEDQLARLEAQEDAIWKQRAKQHWLRGADTNTWFFHRYASAQKKKNSLSRLKNDSGVWVEGERDNELLLPPFAYDEVKATLFSMFPDKASGPNGMNPGFYQHYWDVVGEDVLAFVVNCLSSCFGLNDTNVVLIPKKSIPESVSDLRPIALCNVVYKIMAKSQSVLILNRLITDNILVAVEVGYFLNRKQCGMVGWGALKLDMEKSYDCMKWPFLRKMMLALGFAEKWVELIMLHVTTVSYNFLINEASSGQVVSTYNRLLFFKANVHEAGAIKHCLDVYEGMSSQAVNYHKSSICFSRNTSKSDREEVAGVLGVAQATNFGKYLGLPSFVGRNKRAAFSYIEDKIRRRICSWNKRLLSQAGKEILLKSVAQAMPTFSMRVL
ncbi:uncharacterized protein LOC116011005 [Ipomoea triloba]|uniref:uncharacterized protein LOC116011005 n=1 Tax=Ipomoea triloba TaxID=35885 RepID=UPI00125D28ED|nr:uncharacterized protein LOC116011005 [Ipomoea triloba]